MSTSSDEGEKLLGELVPQGGGDSIPLRKEQLMLGRRETCDIILRFGNVSSNHCELTLESGYWFVKDLGSRNGTRLNGYRISKKRMDPGDTLSIAKRDYKAKYSPAELGAEGPPPDVDVMVEIMSQSLLDGAGLNREGRQKSQGRVGLQKPMTEADDTADSTETEASAEQAAGEKEVSVTDAVNEASDSTARPADEGSASGNDHDTDEYKLAPE